MHFPVDDQAVDVFNLADRPNEELSDCKRQVYRWTSSLKMLWHIQFTYNTILQ